MKPTALTSMLVAGVALAGGIRLASPAAADPDAASDGNFLAALTQAGITYRNAQQAIAVGQSVCELMDNGTSGIDAVREVEKSNPGFTLVGAAKFAVIAADQYCPQHLSGGDGDDGGSGGSGSLQAAVAGSGGH